MREIPKTLTARLSTTMATSCALGKQNDPVRGAAEGSAGCAGGGGRGGGGGAACARGGRGDWEDEQLHSLDENRNKWVDLDLGGRRVT